MSNALGGGNGWLGIVEEVASVALAAETGGASLAITSTFGQVAEQAFTQAAGQMFSQAMTNVASQAFTSAFTQVAEQALGQALSSVAQDAVDRIADAANHQGPGGAYTGELDRAQQGMEHAMQQLLTDASKRRSREGADGGNGADSWLVALARALGEQVGKWAGKMVDASNRMQQMSTGNDQKSAQNFMKLNTEFQADSQMFSVVSQSAATAIKSIGEGLSSVARKQ